MNLEEDLFSVVYENNMAKIQQLLSSGADINIKNKDGNTPLHLAILYRNTSMINTLLRFKADVNIRNNAGLTVLFTAVLANIEWIVKDLLRLGAKHNVYDNNGNLPIHLAAQRGYFNMVKILLREDTVNSYNNDGFAPIHLAVLHNYINIVKVLIEYRHTDINICDNKDENTALILAVQKNYLPITKLLLNNKVNFAKRNKDGKTFNEFATSNEMKSLVLKYGKLLSKLNSDPTQSLSSKPLARKRKKHSDTSSSSENSVSSFPISKHKRYMDQPSTSSFIPKPSMQKYEVLFNISNINSPQPEFSEHGYERSLSRSSINSFRSSVSNNTIIPNPKDELFDAIHNSDVQTMTQVLDLKVDPDMKNVSGQALVHLAASRCDVQMLKELIESGANINIQNNNGNTALHSVFYEFPSHINYLKEVAKTVQFLCESKADINIKNNDGNTALFAAVANDFVGEVKLLIERGARVDIKNKYGWSLLHAAAFYGNPDMVELLYDHGLDINAINDDGETALSIAISSYDSESTARSSGDLKSIAQFLLGKSGIYTNIPNNKGNLPIHLAATKKRYSSVIKKILNIDKSSIDHQNHEGFTPLHLAVKCSNRDAIKILIKYSCVKNIGTAFTLATEVDNRYLLEDIINSKEERSSESSEDECEKPLNDANKDLFNFPSDIWKLQCKGKRSVCSSDTELPATTFSHSLSSVVSAQCRSNSSGELSSKSSLCQKFVDSLGINGPEYYLQPTNCRKPGHR